MYIFINLCITTRWLGIFAMQTADEVFNFEELMCHVEADRSAVVHMSLSLPNNNPALKTQRRHSEYSSTFRMHTILSEQTALLYRI